MLRRLRKTEVCPIHRRSDCCGRGGVNVVSKRQSRQWELIAPGVRRYYDGREVRSKAALKLLKDQKLRTNPRCIFCLQPFTDYRDVDLCHIESCGMNGWRRNDSAMNTELGHRITNLDCGSRSIGEYMNDIRNAGKKFPCEAQ